MQSRARTLAPAGDPQALAYLELLASTGPLTPATHPAAPADGPTDAELAYLELLASDGPLPEIRRPATAHPVDTRNRAGQRSTPPVTGRSPLSICDR